MRTSLCKSTLVTILIVCCAAQAFAANKETINTVEAYIGETSIRVDIFCRNEVGLLEYFNLIVFDDSKLDFASIEADRGVLWYGANPTHVAGDHIYVHGVGSPPSYCIDPDLGEPGNPLYHITFNVKTGVETGLAELNFSSEGVWNGHWSDCSGYQITPDPDYYDGGVDILGHAGHITIGTDSVNAGEQAVVDVYMHNDLDVFEYFNQMLFDDGVADVDSIVAVRGVLHYGYNPTHVSGDTIFIHGWVGDEVCFYADHSYPGATLYRIYFTLHEWAPLGYTMPLSYLEGSLLWNHWVGCDLYTTDLFDATDGSVYILDPTGKDNEYPGVAKTRLGHAFPNPAAHGTHISYYLAEATRVKVAVYDAAGRKITTLAEGHRNPGWHGVEWNGTDDSGKGIASGIYFYRLQAGTATYTKKLVVIK